MLRPWSGLSLAHDNQDSTHCCTAHSLLEREDVSKVEILSYVGFQGSDAFLKELVCNLAIIYGHASCL